MNHEQLFSALTYCVKTNRPAFIQGPPGIGKTEGIYEWAQSIGYECITQSAVCYDVTDFKGIPGINRETGCSKWFPPELFAQVMDGRKVVIFWDDLPTAPQSVQAGLYRAMSEHMLGDRKLPNTVYLCGAGNRAIDQAAVNQMPTPLRNRMWHATLEASTDGWVKWALRKNVATPVIAFMRFRPQLLHVFDKTQYAFPTPRSWRYVSDFMLENPPESLEYDLYSGSVGEAAAIELCGFLRLYRSLPELDSILMSPSTAPVPDEPSTLYALGTALGRKATPMNMDSVVQYCNRMPAEFSVLTVRDAIARDKALTSTRAYIKWATANQNVIL